MKKIKKEKKTPVLDLVKNDPWLEPVAQEVADRYERYKKRLRQIEKDYGSIGKFADAYNYFGINYDEVRKGWVYREWAPHAYSLFLIGDFNDWNRGSHPLRKNEKGVWEIFLDERTCGNKFIHGSRVKVLVHGANGTRERIPAYIRRVVQDEGSKDFAGQLWFPESFDWEENGFDVQKVKPLLIYECHVGMAQEREGVGTYREFAELILPRIKHNGYTAIQVMAIAEHPYYGSFGYHVSNFFATSSRFGTPEDLKYLILEAHRLGIAVIMDIVHSHTVKNVNEGINEFDGMEGQYFHPGGRGEHPAWDSKLFNYGKKEVLQFLLSNLKYWLEEYHFDGFRFDGVTSMLYFHHGYTSFDRREKYFTEGVEWDAITYLQLANTLIKEIHPGAISIAEDVSGMPGLCRPIREGGIGFDFRLAMGIPDYWIRLLKEKKDENWDIQEMWQILSDRRPDVGTIVYAESHDQALVGDKTIAFRLMDREMYDKMGIQDDSPIIDRGLALHKMLRLFTISLGGQAYLNFMGNEFGHPEWIDFPREGNGWSHKYARRQWSLADRPDLKYRFLNQFDIHMLRFVKEYGVLNGNYGNLLFMDDWHKTVVFEKVGLVFVFNFHVNQSAPGYRIPVLQEGTYRSVLSTDNPLFGGHGRFDERIDYPTFRDKDGDVFLKMYNPNRTAIVLKPSA